MIKRTLFALAATGIFLMGFAAFTSAQQVVRVAGWVYDKETSKPIPGVEIVAYMQNRPQNKLTSKTDAKGKFTLAGLVPGLAIFELTKAGYQPIGQPKRLSSTRPRTTFKFYLTPIKREEGTINPDIKERYDMAMKLYQDKNLDEALGIFQSLVENYPDLHQINVNVAIIYLDKGDFDSAITYLNAAHNGDPENIDVMTYLGEAYLAKEDLESALKWYKMAADKALEKAASGTPHQALFLMLEKTADLARALEKYDLAIEYYRKALSIDDSKPVAHLYLGTLLDLQQRRNEALVHLMKYIELDPSGSEVKYTHQSIESIVDSELKAEEALRNMLAEDDTKALPHFYLGMKLAQKGGSDQDALSHLQRYLALDTDDTYGKKEHANQLIGALTGGGE